MVKNKISIKDYKKEKAKTNHQENDTETRPVPRKSRNVSAFTLVLCVFLVISIGINYGSWNVRFRDGVLAGYDDGYDEGHEDGEDVGKVDGFYRGHKVGYTSGFQVGLIDGEQNGYDEGYEEGLEDGAADGFEDGFTDGFDEGYYEGVVDGAGHGYDVRDPTYSEAIQFMKKDKTDTRKYTDNFVCHHFVATFKQNAFDAGFKCYYVSMDFKDTKTGHAIVGFETVDEGLVFIEPQLDRVVKVVKGKSYSSLNNFVPKEYDIIDDYILIP